jgi:hypothetical protein
MPPSHDTNHLLQNWAVICLVGHVTSFAKLYRPYTCMGVKCSLKFQSKENAYGIVYAGWRKNVVYLWASVFICVETDFSSCFAREILPKILDDLNSAIEIGFVKIDNDPQLCKTVCLSITKYLEQCISPEGSQVKHFKQIYSLLFPSTTEQLITLIHT